MTARPNRLLGAGLVGIVASTVFFHDQIPGFWPMVFGFPLLSFSVVLVVMAGSERNALIGRYPVPGAGALAAGSYSLYLSHKAVFHAVQVIAPQLPAQAQGAAFVLAFAGALGVGAALYWLVERPFLKLRDRLEGPSRRSLAVATAVELPR
jgi:peptidoglycan/LPS O-acetylase OafA/YrhL